MQTTEASTQQSTQQPVEQTTQPVTLNVNGQDLYQALYPAEITARAAGSYMPILQNVVVRGVVDGEQGRLIIEATDRYALIRARVDVLGTTSAAEAEAFGNRLIPLHGVKEMIRVAKAHKTNPVEVSVERDGRITIGSDEAAALIAPSVEEFTRFPALGKILAKAKAEGIDRDGPIVLNVQKLHRLTRIQTVLPKTETVTITGTESPTQPIVMTVSTWLVMALMPIRVEEDTHVAQHKAAMALADL